MPLPSTIRRSCLALSVAWSALAGSEACAQRVQFPSAVPGYVPPSSSWSSAGGLSGAFDPYATSPLSAPPLNIPYAVPPSTPAPVYGAPPAFTPSYGAAPYGAPTLPAPTVAAPYSPLPPPTRGLFEGWEWPDWGFRRGTYNYQNPDGSVARVQRFLQQVSVEHTWLAGEPSLRDVEINRTELAATFGVPIFSNPETPLLLTPGFAFNWWEGPAGPPADLPPRTYDAYLDAAWRPRLSDWFSADLGVRTGVWTDFDVVNADSLRILGRGLGVVSLSPRLDVHAGVWYLDRNHVKLLPAGGVHWRPTPDFDAYLVFPNPRVRRRFVNLGSSQWWWYAGGEYGGGRWTIKRASGADDFDYNDIRIFGGLEWLTQSQARGHVEAGVVFDRELRFRETGNPAKYSLDETVMVRAGVDF